MTSESRPASVEYSKIAPPVYRNAAGRVLDDSEVAALAAAEQEKHVSEARAILEMYLHRLGLSSPKDAAQQVQVTLLRQWVEHLDEVLEAEGLPGDVRIRIVRTVIYGGAPNLAEAEIRQQMAAEMVDLARRTTIPRMTP